MSGIQVVNVKSLRLKNDMAGVSLSKPQMSVCSEAPQQAQRAGRRRRRCGQLSSHVTEKHRPFAPSQVSISPEHADESGALLVLPLPPLLQPLQLSSALFYLPTQREDLAFQLWRKSAKAQLKQVTAENAITVSI